MVINYPEKIIHSMLDTDLYKFTMQQLVLHQFSDTEVEYEFKLRNYAHFDLVELIDDINHQLNMLCELTFSDVELEYLSTFRWFKNDYIDYLRRFNLNRNHIMVYIHDDDVDGLYKKGDLRISIKGPWVSTILFETPVLAIVSELFSKRHVVLSDNFLESFHAEGLLKLKDKIKFVNDSYICRYGCKISEQINCNGVDGNCPVCPSIIKIIDFGTRRRFTREWHEIVLKKLITEIPEVVIGTSNVDLARRLNVKPIGTMAHEFLQATQGMYDRCGLLGSQKLALDTWVREYRGDLGIVLSDCLGFDAFLNDFDPFFAKLYDGVRHDSGDPYVWCDRLISHYVSMGIDPRTKTAVFSDGLNFEKAVKLHKMYDGKINTSFGIGTNITNDVEMVAPQIVIKMTRCNGQPVAKISDSPGKMMCTDNEYLKYLSRTFGIDTVWEE